MEYFATKKIFRLQILKTTPIIYSIRKEKIEFYIADFYCAQLRLIIEVDGKIHEKQIEYDRERDIKLLKKGRFVFRIKNKDVINIADATNVLQYIIQRRITEIS